MTRTSITATVRLHGTHYWKDAPEAVAYLRNVHRHEFVLRVTCLVFHDDRDVEFHLLQGEVREAVRGLWDEEPAGFAFGGSSCESIARRVGESLRSAHGERIVSVAVWEDDENGACVTWGGPQ